jgi:four helix bundle protein
MNGPRKHGAEGLRVLGLAEKVAAEVVVLVRRARVRQSLADQATRCADSAVLNLAEGGSHFQPGLKLNNYRAAHASAGELVAALRRIGQDDPGAPVRDMIRRTNHVQVMTASLIRAQLRRRDRPADIPASPPPHRD